MAAGTETASSHALAAIDPPAGGPDAEVPDDLRGFFTPEMFGPYFRGNMFASIAIRGRTSDDEARRVAKEHQQMAAATVEAWDTVRKR